MRPLGSDMRIAFDARWYNQSGVGTYIRQLLNAICAADSELQLYVFEEAGKPVPFCPAARLSRVAVRSSKLSLGSQYELRTLCRSLHIDLFHSPFQYGVPLFLPCPLVITVHDLIPFLFRTRDWYKQLAAVPWVKLGCRVAALRTRHIITDSLNTAHDVEKILGVPATRITTVHLAASDDAFHSNRSQRETERLEQTYRLCPPYAVVGSAGCNWRTKNLDTAIEAVASASRAMGRRIQLAIYGPRTAIENLKNPAVLSQVDVRYLGYMPVEDIGALLRNAELFLMTSLYEGFGLPILEAMSCACPVITSSGGSLAEVAGDGALIFDPKDSRGMSQAIALLLTNREKRERWRKRALARAAEFSWRKAAEQTIAAYRQVLDPLAAKSRAVTCQSAGMPEGRRSA